MNNQYIFIPQLNIDLEEIKRIVIKNMTKFVDGLATHQRRVADEPYLESIRQQYPFLSQQYNIYTTPPSCNVPIHICPERGCALNVPILYTADSHTIFYDLVGEVKKEYSKERIYEIITSNAVEVFRYTLTQPVVMNTLLPHSVIGGPKFSRTIMSWSILTSYEETKQLVGVL
jgi:hypothetical protein